MEYSTKRGKRVNSYEAFLEDIENRENLKILRYSHVHKVRFEFKAHFVCILFDRETMISTSICRFI